MTIAPFYLGWEFANQQLVDALEDLTPAQLAIPIRTDWPIWASAAHVAGARAYWLCHVAKEPGAGSTPFADPNAGGWEDDLGHPRSGAELGAALASTWRVVERCLATWTPASLSQELRVTRGDQVRIHTRQSLLMRLITHDAFHSGEIAAVLGNNGLGSGSPNGAIDLWSGLARDASSGA